MSLPDILRGTYFILAMGDGATPTETFDPLCGITTRQFQAQSNTTDQFIRDCADPEDIPIRRLIVTGEQWSLSGNGSLNRAQIADIIAAKGVSKNYRFYWTEPADDQVYAGYFEGQAILTNFTIDGNDDQYGQLSVQIESDGAWTFTPTAGS
jgi:predicted secreted protein